MTDAFLTVFNLSITASWFVFAILILRKLFKKAPRSIFCILWLLVGIRLAIPFSIESIFSLVPSAETVSPDIIYEAAPNIQTGIPPVNNIINPILEENFAATPQYSANPIQIAIAIASYIWIIGAAIVVLYGIISYIILKIKVREAVPLEDNIKQSAKIASPFILGFIRPKIYIPFGMSESNLRYVLAHEKSHLKRRDHLIKPIGFMLLAVYWFNPVIWIAYIFLCRDIELACDEKVVQDFEADERAKYATALLDCSINRRSIAACPLAFGEVGVKERIKNALSYKKPMLWIIIATVIGAIIITVCFMTDPKADDTIPLDTEPETDVTTSDDTPEIEMNWNIKKIGYAPKLAEYMCGNENGNACIKISNIGELEAFLAELKPNPFEDITDPIKKAYFENNLLVAVYYTSGSGSNIYSIENVDIDADNKKITVSALLTIPEVGTDDMSGWLGLIEVKNVPEADIADYECATELHTRQYTSPILKKTSIKKTDNWKTEGLKSAGLEGVEISDFQNFSQGTLYLLEEKEPFSIFSRHFFFAVETEDRILLSRAGVGNELHYVGFCDVDGEAGEEILYMIPVGTGGAYAYVYKASEDKLICLLEPFYSLPNCCSSELMATFKVVIYNNFNNTKTIVDVSADKDAFTNNIYPYFDKDGNPLTTNGASFNLLANANAVDTDGDGIYELHVSQKVSFGATAYNIGVIDATLKYDKSSGTFKIIDAEFVPYREKEGKITTDYYELTAFTQKPTDSHFTYTYTVFTKDGDILMGASTNRKPRIEMISDNDLRVYTQAGTDLSTAYNYYFDVEKGFVSDEYTYVLDDTDKLITYGYFNGETTSLVVKNIFNDSYKKEFILDKIATDMTDPIISAEFSEDGKYIKVEYFTEKYFTDSNHETSIIDLPL